MALKSGQSKGQAAITDAMYFLIISTTLAAFLFVFSLHFGEAMSEKIQGQELQEYTSSALKTILYTTIPRQNAGDPSLESDFLLAAVKEDFADDQKLNDTATIIQSDVKAAMLPLLGSYDYIFYFEINPNSPNPNPLATLDRFPYFLYYKSVSETVFDSGSHRYVTVQGQGHESYFCKPTSSNTIQQLLFRVGNKAQSTGKAKLLIRQATNTYFPLQLDVYLVVWVSESIDTVDPVFSALSCCKADEGTCLNTQFGTPPSA